MQLCVPCYSLFFFPHKLLQLKRLCTVSYFLQGRHFPLHRHAARYRVNSAPGVVTKQKRIKGAFRLRGFACSRDGNGLPVSSRYLLLCE
jgi:hypothetical protein